jgi:hypothetical protein
MADLTGLPYGHRRSIRRRERVEWSWVSAFRDRRNGGLDVDLDCCVQAMQVRT